MTGPPSSRDILAASPAIPADDDGPVFAEPWQAQAFAMAVNLHENGCFTWTEWAQALGAEIERAGPQAPAEDYYLHWLSALEHLSAAKHLATSRELADRKAAWDRAARATPHGEPIELGRENRG